jgi:hypothetical protein
VPKPVHTRSRVIPGHQASAELRQQFLANPAMTTGSQSGPVLTGRQITVSEGHQWPPPRKEEVVIDRGGDFFTTKTYVASGQPSVDSVSVRLPGSNWTYSQKGTWYPVPPDAPHDSLFPPANHSSNDKLDELGALAVDRCKPTNSPADVSTFLGELWREGLPSLIGSTAWKSKSDSLRKKGGSEYLNVQFGWMPIVREIRGFANAVRKADQVLAQYERDAGRLVRRTYRFPLEREQSESVWKPSVSARTPFMDGSTGTYAYPLGDAILRRETRRETWFSGAFTYHLPSGYDSRKTMERIALEAKVVFGATPSPETIWNLAPWSWAVDWFSNTGAVISNLQDYATSGLVMRYGYVMEKSTTKYTYTLTKSGRNNPRVGMQPLILVRETKVRRKANPFGFGLTWDGLSPFQMSIAAALGITRGGR